MTPEKEFSLESSTIESSIKNKKDAISYIEKESIDKLLDASKKLRNRLIIRCLFETGCTVNELSNIRVRDIDFQNNKIRFIASNTRNKEYKESVISEELKTNIKLFLKEKGNLNKKTAYLFETRTNKSITTRRIRQIVENIGKKTGIKNLLPQTIRYSHLIYAMKNAISLASIESQTGIKMSRLIQIFNQIRLKPQEEEYKRFFLNKE